MAQPLPIWAFKHFTIKPVAMAMARAGIIRVYCPRFNGTPAGRLVDREKGIMEFWGITGFSRM